MHFSLVVFSSFTILLTFGASSDDDEIQKQLIKISNQLDRVELQLNTSVNQLLNKMDEKNLDAMNLIKSFHVPKTDGGSPFFHILKSGSIFLLIFHFAIYFYRQEQSFDSTC